MSALSWFEIAIFIMLALVFARPFLPNQKRAVTFAYFAPVAVFFSIFGFFALNFNFSYCVFFALSALALLIALPSLRALRLQVFAGEYSFFYRAICFLAFAGLCAASYFSFIYRVDLRPRVDGKRVVLEHKVEQFICGSDEVFLPKIRFFDIPNAVAHIFYPKNFSNLDSARVYAVVPNVFASASDYFATAECLAERGNVVILADFFISSQKYDESVFDNPISRNFYLRQKDFLDKNFSKSRAQKWNDLKKREIKNLAQLLSKISDDNFNKICDGGANGENLIFVVDNLNLNLALETLPQISSDFHNFFILNSAENPIPGYLDGYGDLAALHPIEYLLRVNSAGGVKTKGWTQAKLIAAKAAANLEKK